MTEAHAWPTASILVAHPTLDGYGADLQVLESIRAMRSAGWRVVVVATGDGPLRAQLEALGADVRIVLSPVLRRGLANPRGLATLAGQLTRSVRPMRRVIDEVRPDLVYVNTVTLPGWSLVGWLARLPTVVHVHEGDAGEPTAVRAALNLPLSFAGELWCNGSSAASAVATPTSWLRRRVQLAPNGVPGPAQATFAHRSPGEPFRVLTVGRLSPKKAQDVLLEAVAQLRREGRDVLLEICGTIYPGNEPFEDRLRTRATEPDLVGAVHFAGYVQPVWPALARCHVLAAPSLVESFGNTVVEAQHAVRPVVATRIAGHLETARHRETALLVPPEDSAAMADGLRSLMDDESLRQQIAEAGARNAAEHFSVERYQARILTLARGAIGRSNGRRRAARRRAS